MFLHLQAFRLACALTATTSVAVAQTAQTTPAKPAVSHAVFPKAIAAKYIKESAGNARRDTCLDQYKANKATSGNGGLRWIQKGGGYYSVCSTKLKG